MDLVVAQWVLGAAQMSVAPWSSAPILEAPSLLPSLIGVQKRALSKDCSLLLRTMGAEGWWMPPCALK